MWMNGKNYKRARNINEFSLGRRVWFIYVPPEPNKQKQFKIGQKVRIDDNKTNKTLAYYKVEFTNENNVGGIVCKMADGGKNSGD